MLGLHIDLVGWEETITGFGRPQALINRDLDQCELFFGMVWERWGTPPAVETEYQSGFEEEFHRAVNRRKSGENVEICLLLKDPRPEMLKDPGPQIQRVQRFRSELIEKKEIYFEQFAETSEFEEKFRRVIYKYVSQKIEAEQAVDGGNDEDAVVNSEADSDAEMSLGYLLPQEVETFFSSLISDSRLADGEDQISAEQIARIRLVASSMSKVGNDDHVIGAHDANLMFNQRFDVDLSRAEQRALLRSGLSSFGSENIPIWYWYERLEDSDHEPLSVNSVVATPEAARVGAIHALQVLGLNIDGGVFERDQIVDSWLRSKHADVVSAGLSYLSDFGGSDDVGLLVRHMAGSSGQQTAQYVDAKIRILARSNQSKAFDELLRLDPVRPSSAVIAALFDESASLSAKQLIDAFSLKADSVRLHAARELHHRGALNEELARRLASDSSADVRVIGVTSLEHQGVLADEREFRSLIVNKRKEGLLWLSSSGSDGESQYVEFRKLRLGKLEKSELLKLEGEADFLDDDLRFVAAEREFRVLGEQLRADIDDRFNGAAEEHLASIRKLGTEGQKLAEKWLGLIPDVVLKMLSRGCEVLARKDDSLDLPRIRGVLDAYDIKFNPDIVAYLGHHGQDEDVERILKLVENPGHGLGLLSRDFDGQARFGAATDAVIGIMSEASLIELVGRLPAKMTPFAISVFPKSRFLKISDAELLILLNLEFDEARKAVGLRMVRDCSKRTLRRVLSQLTKVGSTYYYNAVHWLDFGISLEQKMCRATARRLVKAKWTDFVSNP